MKIRDLLQKAEQDLISSGVEEARFEAGYLLRFFLGISQAELYIRLDEEIDVDGFAELIHRRAQGEPTAYIVGQKEFYGMPFKVNKDVLIPRPETEVLIEEILKLYGDKSGLNIFDVGTGSGAIAVTLAKKLHKPKVWAYDISPKALEVATENAILLGAQNIEFIESNLLEKAPDVQVDIIAANLPYVPQGEAQTHGFEPDSALYCGEDPLSLINQLCGYLNKYLKKGGGVFLEVGIGQAASVGQIIFKSLPDLARWQIVNDLAGIPRIIWAVRS